MNGMTESRIYLDANVFIYAMEGSDDIAGVLHKLFGLFREKRGVGVTSELTLAEVLPKANPIQRRNYLDLIVWSRIFDLRPVSRDVLIETADYRKSAGNTTKLPDAIHVVTAVRSECRTVISSDSRLKLPVGYAVLAPDRGSLSHLIEELS
jgi:predicted nucleic acid-binding protein